MSADGPAASGLPSSGSRPTVPCVTAPPRVGVLRSGTAGRRLLDHLRRCGLDRPTGRTATPCWCSGPSTRPPLPARRAGTPVLLLGSDHAGSLWDAAGLLPGRCCPRTPCGCVPAATPARSPPGSAATRWSCTAAWPLQDKVADDVEQLLTANSAFHDHPVATWRPATSVGTLRRLAARLRRPGLRPARPPAAAPRPRARDAPAVRVGMLGYGAIGHEHAVAIARTEGLELAAVCDPSRAHRGGAGVRPGRPRPRRRRRPARRRRRRPGHRVDAAQHPRRLGPARAAGRQARRRGEAVLHHGRGGRPADRRRRATPA